jgi:hypothetical protein
MKHSESPILALLFTNLAIMLEAITVTGLFSTLVYSALAVAVGWAMDYARKKILLKSKPPERPKGGEPPLRK